MNVEFHAAKDARNIRKHGISLVRFMDMELDAALVIPQVRSAEDREVIFAPIDGRLHVAVTTRRDSGIRVISLRRANNRERRLYDEAISSD